MKKKIVIILMSLLLVGCNDKNTEIISEEQTNISSTFYVNKITEEGIILQQGNNKESLFIIDKEKLNDDKIKEGDKYKITWDGSTLMSYPAQFGEIYNIEKIN